MKSPNEKTLIILDNDQSLTDKTGMYYVAEILFTKEEYEYFCNENAKDKNWVDSFNRFYKMLKDKKISLSKLTSTVESIEKTRTKKNKKK